MTADELERAAEALEASGDYRVLRRLVRRDAYALPDHGDVRVGVIVDVETTGLDPAKDEIVELGMVRFEWSPDGRVFRVTGEFQGFSEPSSPLPPDITELTGITPEMLAGQYIDPLLVAGFVDGATLAVAHNARFDRRFCERRWDRFATMPWSCSASQIDWRAEGFDGARLSHILAGFGLFHAGHRAVEDCFALLEAVARPLPKSGRPALAALAEAASRRTVRFLAEGAPYSMKDVLKARGYRWSDGSDGRPRCWWTDVPEERAEAELAFLRSEVYRRDVDVPTRVLTAYERFSMRE